MPNRAMPRDLVPGHALTGHLHVLPRRMIGTCAGRARSCRRRQQAAHLSQTRGGRARAQLLRDSSTMATPPADRHTFARTRVAHDIARHLEKVRLTLDELRVVRRFEEVAPTVVPPVEALCVPTVESSHSSRDVRLGRPDCQVEVISHQAEGEAPPLESRDRMAKAAQKSAAIEVVGEDRGARVSPRGHVIEGAGHLGPRVTSHLPTIRTLRSRSREGHTLDPRMARTREDQRGHVLGPGPGACWCWPCPGTWSRDTAGWGIRGRVGSLVRT